MDLDERTKIASGVTGMAAGLLRRPLRAMTAGVGRGALLGAGAGGALGATRAALEGEDTGGVLRGALRGGVMGGVGGAVVGGGGRALRDTALLHPNLGAGGVVAETGKRLAQGAGNAVKRQVHGLTGLGDPRSMGFDSSVRAAQKSTLEARRMLDEARHGGGMARIQQGAQRLEEFAREGARGDARIDAGITNLPGVAKGLATKPKETLKALWDANTNGGGAMGVAGAVGLPALAATPELLRGDESGSGGRSIGQKLTRLGVGMGSGLAFAGLPMGAAMAADVGVDAVTDRLIGAPRGNPKRIATNTSMPTPAMQVAR